MPAGTLDFSVSSNWTPRVFRVHYVLPTREGPFIFVNNAFKKVMRTFGADTTDEVLNRLHKNDPGILRKRYEGLIHSEKTHEIVEFFEDFGDVKIASKARFLTRMGDKIAYAFVIKVLSAKK